jgi:hypothetical protein
MILGVALLVVGLLAPYALRRHSGHMSPRLVLAAHLSGLVLAWLGILELVGALVMPEHGLLGLCRAAFGMSHGIGNVRSEWLLLPVTAALGGRALVVMTRTYRVVRRARRRISAVGRPGSTGVMFAEIGTVAYTVGFMRPRIVVDRGRFGSLTGAQQRAIIAHEHSHARGLHALIDLAARGLSAGLSPWPGARVSYGEIRRHLEAAADDWAARHTSHRDVATAIVEAAVSSAPTAALGAAGWAVWRVDRLLSPRPRLVRHALLALALVGLTAVVVLQMSGHVVTGVHVLPAPFHCCVD